MVRLCMAKSKCLEIILRKVTILFRPFTASGEWKCNV